MTDKEKAIVMAYTGICMLSGDKFQIFHKYVEKIMGRPVYTHEMSIKVIEDEIKEKAKADFIALCAEQDPKIEHCKDCKYFEYDSVAKVDGIPLIVAHEICSRWGDGCKTKEDGYCFMYEPRESEV